MSKITHAEELYRSGGAAAARALGCWRLARRRRRRERAPRYGACCRATRRRLNTERNVRGGGGGGTSQRHRPSLGVKLFAWWKCRAGGVERLRAAA